MLLAFIQRGWENPGRAVRRSFFVDNGPQKNRQTG